MRLVPVALLCALLLACGPGEEPEPEPNEPPIARALWPERWLVSEPVPIDASRSEDVDGRLVRITAIFGDGTKAQTQADGRFLHLYPSPGAYDLRVEVEDDDGATAEVLGTVVLVERMDDPPCDCELGCLSSAICTSEGCFLSAVSDDVPEGFEGAPIPDDALSCP